MGEKIKAVTTINECHFGAKAHEDLGASGGFRSLWIEIPDSCHLQCDYCFASTKRGHPHKCAQGLTETEYLKLLDDFHEAGGQYLGIPGNGEPFHPRNRGLVMAILRHATDIGLLTTVFTTADSIFFPIDGNKSYRQILKGSPDDSLARELFPLNVILLVKFNSAHSDVQDKLVKQPGYTNARSLAMQKLIELGFTEKRRLGIVTSILPENKDEIFDLYQYAEKNNLIFDCDTILPRGRGCEWKERHDVSPNECRAIYERINRLGGDRSTSGGTYIGPACDRVRHHLYIDVKGEAYPCIGCVGKDPGFCLGNIRQMPILSLWNHNLRVQLRENLAQTLTGPCTWCENFEKTCWSCFGRQVVRADIRSGSATLSTKGCFNHRPRIDQWMAACNREMRRLILRVGRPGYQSLRQNFLALIRKSGIESLWSMNGVDLRDGGDLLAKDIQYSQIRLFGADVWDAIQPPDLPASGAAQEAQVLLDADDRHYLERLKSILPRFFIPTIRLLVERFDKHLGYVGAPGMMDSGLMQFCLFMFYMPERKRYFYRSVAFNNLDGGSVKREEVRRSLVEANRSIPEVENQCRINNRRVRLVQRWAESFREGEAARILPYIRNFSRDMEADHLSTYELILSRELFDRHAEEIDRESRFYPKRRILGVSPLLDMPAVRGRIRHLSERVDRLVEDEDQWEKIESVLSSGVFAWEGEECTNPLRAIYDNLGDSAFFSAEKMTDEERESVWFEVRESVADILFKQVWIFPEGGEKSWFPKDLRAKLDSLDWGEFLEITHKNRRQNMLEMHLPDVFDIGTDLDKRVCVIERVYNRLLVEFVRLFWNDRGDRHPEWLLALNYFVWLGYFRDVLGVQDYFVLHAPNLQQHCSVLFQDQMPLLPASGMILSSADRLPVFMREACEELLRTIIAPVEELSFANVSSESGKTAGYQQGEYMISHELDTPLGVLFQEWDRLSPVGRLAINYLEMWRRFAKREWSDALPPEMDALFRAEKDLFDIAFTFGYGRASGRGKIPLRFSEGRLRSWKCEELLDDTVHWLDTSLELPKELLESSEAWVFQVKVWLLFMLIGSCHHVIQYTFGKTKRLDSWETAPNLRRANLTLFSRAVSDGRREIVIRNSGDAADEPSAAASDVIKGIRSGTLGLVRLPPKEYPDGRVVMVEVHPHEYIPSREGQPAFWQAAIVIITQQTC